MPDVLQTVGNKNWLPIVATKILEIGWMLLKTSTGGNLIWATSSTSSGSQCKLNFLHIFCNLFTFHFFFTPVPNGARLFLGYRLDSTRLDFILANTDWLHVLQYVASSMDMALASHHFPIILQLDVAIPKRVAQPRVHQCDVASLESHVTCRPPLHQ